MSDMNDMNVRQTILVVDDNEANRRLIAAHLGGAGYLVTLAENGARAIELFGRGAYDLVLLDIMMPGIDGFATCRALREMTGGAEVPIVFLTALADLGTHQTAMASGADDFLTKPINRTELLVRVRSLLRIRKMGQKVRDLMSFIVHDLKNPLAAILANSQSLHTRGWSEDDLREILADVESAARSMLRMVLNLLDVGRSEDGVLKIRPSSVDVGELVNGVVTLMRPRFAERGLRAEVAMPRTMVAIDADLVRRVLENLVDNCVKHSPERGTVRIAGAVEGDALELRVSDEGPGIPADLRERIFEKYVQLEDHGSGVSRAGRGLGLAFCRMAAEAHGGRVWAEANQPTGTVFGVRIAALRGVGTAPG